MIRQIVYAAWSAAEGVGLFAGDFIDWIWPPKHVPPPVSAFWTDGTDSLDVPTPSGHRPRTSSGWCGGSSVV